MNPLSFLLCLPSLLPAAVTELETQTSASQTASLAAQRRELAEIRLLIQAQRDFANAKQRLAKLAEALAPRAEADARDLAAEVERVRQDVALALGESVTPASGQDAVDRAVQDALAREDLHFINQLGSRAVPGLVQAVRANPDVFPSDGAKDPLALLAMNDSLAASRLAQELLHQDGFFWKKRVVRMLGFVEVSDNDLWRNGIQPEWRGIGLSATAETLVDDPDVGSEALQFLLQIAKHGWRSDALDATLARALHSPDGDRRYSVESAIKGTPELAGRARLEGWLGDEDRRLRAFAINQLAAAFPESDLPLTCQADSSWEVRHAVGWWLFRKRSSRWTAAELDALVRLLRDESEPVSESAWGNLTKLPSVHYAPPIPDPELARMFGTRLVYADPLPEEALLGLLEAEKDPKRREILADFAARLPVALALHVLAVLANDREQAVLEEVRESLQPVLALEDPQGYVHVIGALLDNEASTERRKIHFLVGWYTKTLPGLRVMLPWLLARRDAALFVDVFGEGPFDPEVLIQAAQPADVVEFVAQAWDFVREKTKRVCNDEFQWTPEHSAAFRELARDEGRPLGLRAVALRAALFRGSADDDAAAIARSMLSGDWGEGKELEATVETFFRVLMDFPGAQTNGLIADILRNPALPHLLDVRAVSTMRAGEAGAGEIVELVIERGFGKESWREPVQKVLEAMGYVPALQDPAILVRAAREPLHGQTALETIGKLRDPSYLPLLAELVENPGSSSARNRAVNALLCYLDAEVAEILLVAATKVSDPDVRDRCLAHLEKIREYQEAKERWATRKVKAQTREQVIAELVTQLGSKSDEVKVQAIRALATWEAVEVMPRLIELTASGSKSVAAAAREALARLNQPPAEARKE